MLRRVALLTSLFALVAAAPAAASGTLTVKKVDTSGYNAVQQRSAAIIAGTKNIAQFLDRDTRPDFASTVMIPALQSFIQNPNDVDSILSNVENQKKSIFTG